MPSACYVYAIVGRDTPLPRVDGGRDAEALTMVSWRELGAVTRHVAADAAPFTMEAVLYHEAVVEAVRRQGPALPVRFGTLFRDATSLTSAIAERYEPLAADLDRLGDKVELSLTALWASRALDDELAPERPEREASTRQSVGARYLFARAAELRRADALKDRALAVDRELDRVLGALALDRRVSLLPTPRVAVRAAYLLDPARVDAFKAAFQATHRSRSEVRLLLTGPWPPYSFVRRTETADSAANERIAELAQLLTEPRQ